MTGRGPGPERPGRALLLAALMLVCLGLDARGQELDEWLDLAHRSTAVVTGVVAEPGLSVEDAQRRAPRIVSQGGQHVMQLTSPGEYILGGLWRFRVEEVVKGDGRVTPQGRVEVFDEGGLARAEVGGRYLLFLRSPIVPSGSPDTLNGWRSLYGTVLTNPASEEDVAPFDPSTAYDVTPVPEISPAVGALEVTEANASQVAAIVAALRAATVPSATIVEPKQGDFVSGSLALAATATDDVAVLGVRFQLDGSDLGEEVPPEGSGPFRTTWGTTSAPDGPHTLKAVARDGAGNVGVSEGVPIVVDNTPPALQVSPLPAALFPADGRLVTVDMNISVTDAQDPTPVVRLVSVTCPVRQIVGPGSFRRSCSPSRDILEAEPGTDDRQFQLRAVRAAPAREYRITYSARDAAGNVTTASVEVKVAPAESTDNPPPPGF